ncbi:alpha-galactosidase [bacterium]|nr:alpha-galactosidase [bacterium]
MITFTLQWTRDGAPLGTALTHPLGTGAAGILPAPAIAGRTLGAQLTVPIAEIGGVWMPYGDRSTLQKVTWKGHLVGSPFFQPGLIALVDRQLHNRLLLFAEPATREVVYRWALDQAGACYRMEIDFGPQATDTAVALRFSTAAGPVHDVAARVLAEAAPAADTEAPAHCFEPSYCTWYAWHGALDQDSVERGARLARDLGFGTLILDDGWAYDPDQRVGPVLGPWHRFQGDYEPSTRKFPDFRGHIERVQAMGLRFLLWVAPALVGVESRAYQRFGPRLLEPWLQEGARVIDPRDPEMTEYVTAAIERLVATYPVDGFKVDYDYALYGPDQTPYWLGPAYAAFVQRLVARVRAVRPTVEWNLPWNPFSGSVTRAFRAVDVPFDPESNRLVMANLRPLTGRGALYSDPALWSPADPVTVVHRHLVPSLFCVPSVGAPLPDLPAEHHEAIRQWLQFYRRHQDVLNHGAFHAQWADGDFQSFAATRGQRRVLAAFGRLPVIVAGPGETHVINASAAGDVLLEIGGAAEVGVETPDGRQVTAPGQVPSGLQRVACPAGSVIRTRLG